MRFQASPPTHVDAALRDLTSESPLVRRRAADALALATTRRDEVIDALRHALTDPDAELRFAAALALASLDAHEATDALIDLLADPSPLARQGAAKALGDIAPARAFDALAVRIRDPSADVRFQLPAALLQVAPQRAATPLLTLLDDTDAEVRGSAAAALGDLYAPTDDAPPTHDNNAAARIPKAPPLAKPQAPADVIEALSFHLDDVDESVTLDAAIALARLGAPHATPFLIDHLADRDRALLAAAHLFNHPPVQAADALAHHARRLFVEPAVRVYLAGALTRLGDPRGLALLKKALFGRNILAQGLAIKLCGQTPGASTRDLLEALRRHRRGKRWRTEIDDALATTTSPR